MGLFDKISKIFDDRELKKYKKTADEVLALEGEYSSLTDEQLRDKTAQFKQRYQSGETLDSMMTEAFATVREAAKRVVGLMPYHVQVMGAAILHGGNIAEMKTGEGKTLVATMPAYLNALSGKGVHIVTVNEYLASRDAEWMGKIYEFLGLTVGLNLRELDKQGKKAAYEADIMYTTNTELGFDYLRDNMVRSREYIVQRDLNYVIIDEVDSVLIDEARTPLIISSLADKEDDKYFSLADRFAKGLKEEDDYTIDEKAKTATLTEAGFAKAESFFKVENLSDTSDAENSEILHRINQSLKANYIMSRDIDYVIEDGKIIIVDEFTGRLMHGRRFNDGLHQAIEAKENVKVESENKVSATITYQNYFRLYPKTSGMTGTAKTEEEEFKAIYNMDVVCVPLNSVTLNRVDHNDSVFATQDAKFKAIVEEIERVHATGQPILVGTVSIEKSEYLSKLLTRKRIPHNVLNAKNHQREAEIIAQAGQKGTVTISTNMAGRGTDIILGEGVRELGGLYVLGTERHESRRIDNQLIGRSGRQGDPGESRFFVSFEDDMLRIFNHEKSMALIKKATDNDTTSIDFAIASKAIETAQKTVESRNFNARKNVLQFDDVMNKQRDVIYTQRRKILMGDDITQDILGMIERVIEKYVIMYTPEAETGEDWDIEGLTRKVREYFFVQIDLTPFKDRQALIDIIYEAATKVREAKMQMLNDDDLYKAYERYEVLNCVDRHWMEHIDNMSQLKQGIVLRAYAQSNPVQAYTKEGFEMFDEMNENIVDAVVKNIFAVRIEKKKKVEDGVKKKAPVLITNQIKETKVKKTGEISLNAKCPCGSGKKYKRCCGKHLVG
ncbi:MAG: preprotein translocase subunit SecA [Anaerofustis stercorihominis]|nr:preprotein translocase subunit SecA [Anaerofustis stercorihominis]